MLFNSYIFLLLFLPLTILGYFTFNRFKLHRVAMLFLLAMSLWFYGYFNYYYLFIMVGSIALNFLAYKLIGRARHLPKVKLTIAAFAVLINVAALFYFKYFDFFTENVNAVFKTDFALRNIVLPLGISFFTFQQLSFVIDSYHDEIPDYDFIDYACFVTYFPQLVAGPIVTHDELVPQFADKTKKAFCWESFTKGLYTFVLGLAKKVLIADAVGNAVNFGFANVDTLDSISAMLVTLAYTVQIYFDFSGYSDMAIGMGLMMNIELPQNFNSPYKAVSINDFWKRWHITLTRFFTKYIYIPLGGNRKGSARTYLHIMIVYLVSGIWHGANWTFIFWGVCHGIACVLHRCFKRSFDKLPKAVNRVLTMAFVNLMWIFFRADSIIDAFALIGRIFSFDFVGLSGIPDGLVSSVLSAEWQFVLARIDLLSEFKPIILFGYILIPLVCSALCKNVYERMQSFKCTYLNLFVVSALLLLCIFSFSGVSTFLYFNF